VKTLHYNITAGIDAESIEIYEGYSQAVARCSIITPDYGSLGLSDKIEIDIGYTGESGKVFTGYIQSINAEQLPGHYVIEASDVLIKAVEHLIVSIDLDNPFSRRNISMEDLVEDLLNLAGITNYSGDTSHFTLATGEEPAEFQLIFSMAAINQIANIIAWHCYADHNGEVFFKDIKPTPSGAPSHTFSVGTSGNLLVVNRSISTDNLRNKIIIFGAPEIRAEASVVSPYLPANFYKTAVISTELIDTQSMADLSAAYNLDKWNKLTEILQVETLGNYEIHARQTVAVSETFTGASGNWFVNNVTHRFNKGGYMTNMTLVK